MALTRDGEGAMLADSIADGARRVAADATTDARVGEIRVRLARGASRADIARATAAALRTKLPQ